MNRSQSDTPKRYPYLKLLLLLASVLATSFLLTNRTEACGPFFTAYFESLGLKAENLFWSDYTTEQLYKEGAKRGAIDPCFPSKVAYRTLSGNPLSDNEARAIKSLWDDRLNNSFDSDDESWVKKWNEARKAAGATTAAEVHAYRNREKPREYESFLNCQQDAFVNAENLLNERIKLFGAGSTQVNAWLAAQDTVFANCSEGKHLPEPASSNDEALIRADRAYQIAAANFYSTNFDEAKQQFEAIARDRESPYRIIAPYMAARSLLRKGSFAEKEEAGRPFLIDAENRLSAILKDDSLKLSHHAAARLFNLARLRAHPEEKLHELAHLVMRSDASADFKQTVWDYTVLMDKYLDVEDEAARRQLPAGLGSDDLTDWIMTLEGDAERSDAHAIERWEKTRSLPWLVAALSNAESKQPKLNELLSAAANVDHSSPAYPSVAFHSVRLLKEANRRDEARAMLDKILANERARLTASALNLFLSERMMLAQNLDEFLQNAPRVPAAFSDNYDGREIPEDEKDADQTAKRARFFFDLDAANIFNKAMPVVIMKDAAASKLLPPNLRRDVAQAAFVRAAMLDDRETAQQAAASLEAEVPEVKEFLAAYQKATTPDARRFCAAFLTLKFPGLRPFVSAGIGRTTAVDDVDSYRDNYWCTEPPAPLGGEPSAGEQSKANPVLAPDFLSGSKAALTFTIHFAKARRAGSSAASCV